MNVITTRTVFWLEVKIKREDVSSFDKAMSGNDFEIKQSCCAFAGIAVFHIKCTTRKAEIVRALLKNIKIYDLC